MHPGLHILRHTLYNELIFKGISQYGLRQVISGHNHESRSGSVVKNIECRSISLSLCLAAAAVPYHLQVDGRRCSGKRPRAEECLGYLPCLFQ